jgi:hypothetical protein
MLYADLIESNAIEPQCACLWTTAAVAAVAAVADADDCCLALQKIAEAILTGCLVVLALLSGE